MVLQKRKNIRLPKNLYSKPNLIFSITVCTKDRRPLFGNSEWSKMLIKTLKTGPFSNNIECFAYCVMPDHIHLQLSAKNGNLADLINGWKSYTANLLQKNGLEGPCWQRGFYDHALRKEEDIQTVAEYIVNNPVRAGLVKKWEGYPFSWHKWM
jgi:REP-associated tyrosine transposase